tara:strand:- start:702 stop:1289 length:588 start_codon:yes stop_codon:yes gene_type:complete
MREIQIYDDTMFRVPIFKVEIDPWQETKQKILLHTEKSKYHESPNGNKFLTDYNDKIKSDGWFNETDNDYSQDVYEILNPWIGKIVNEVFGKEMPKESPKMWTQRYYKDTEHPIHNHGNRGYSFILYLKYDKDHHLPTKFYGPINQFFTGSLLQYCPKIKEGDLICFPSIINHASQKQKSDKERMILSFNMFPNG